MPINFNRYLKENKLNILKVSRKTGIASSTLYAWRDGKVPLTAAKLDLIANALNVSVDFLLDKTSDPTPIKNLQEEIQKAIEKNLHNTDAAYSELYGIYTDLTDENKDLLLDFAKLLLSRQK